MTTFISSFIFISENYLAWKIHYDTYIVLYISMKSTFILFYFLIFL